MPKATTNLAYCIQGDSQLIINQLSGKYKVKSEKLKIYYEKTKILIKKFENLQIEWITREKNNEADGLANKAYIDFIDNNYAGLYNKLKPYFATDQQINLLRHLKIKPSKYLSRIEANRYLKKYNEKNDIFYSIQFMQSFYLVCLLYILNAQNKEFRKIFRKG